MNTKKSKTSGKGMTLFFVTLAVLFAVLALVKTAQYIGGGKEPQPSASETQATTEETVTAAATTAATTAPIVTTTVPGTQSTTDKVVYLTFDDGPTENTNNILRVLEENGVRGTFFVIHTYDGCEKQIREIHERGHCVALHTYSHKYSIYQSEQAYFDDLGKISDLVYNATGVRSMLVRFPGGTSNTVSRNYKKGIMTTLTKELKARGYEYFDWNVDSSDASAVHVSAEKIVRNSTAAIGNLNQIILLMHDAVAKTTTVDALPDIIRAYREAGYRFDVLSTDSYVWHHPVNN